MQEGRRYKVVNIEKREKQIKEGKESLAYGIGITAISSIWIYLLELSGILNMSLASGIEGIAPTFVALAAASSFSFGLIDLVKGIKKIVSPELDEVSEKIENAVSMEREDEKGRGAK